MKKNTLGMILISPFILFSIGVALFIFGTSLYQGFKDGDWIGAIITYGLAFLIITFVTGLNLIEEKKDDFN